MAITDFTSDKDIAAYPLVIHGLPVSSALVGALTQRNREDRCVAMARYYDPSIGRFISEYPYGFEGRDQNLFRFVWNSPINLIDPVGLGFWSCLGEAAKVVGVIAVGTVAFIALAPAVASALVETAVVTGLVTVGTVFVKAASEFDLSSIETQVSNAAAKRVISGALVTDRGPETIEAARCSAADAGINAAQTLAKGIPGTSFTGTPVKPKRPNLFTKSLRKRHPKIWVPIIPVSQSPIVFSAAFGGVLLLSELITLRLLLASAATLGGVAIVLAQRAEIQTSARK